MPRIIKPQKGPQEKFLATSADICIYGGAAGGGKTFGLWMDPIRYLEVQGYNAVIFRKDYTQITSPGGLWETSQKIYSRVQGAYPLKTPKLRWTFKSGASVNFAHIGRDDEVQSWQGSQITYIGFDELTHFSEYAFFYMLSRNRTVCGVRPYVRATCNPDVDSWVANFIKWWIDQDTGYPIPERSGKKRWMVRISDKVTWVDTREEGVRTALENGMSRAEAEIMPKSVTFIASSLKDNKILMERDPSYRANLLSLPTVERERLLKGNWKIRPAGGDYFKRSKVQVLAAVPTDVTRWVRAWDLAATTSSEDKDAACTAGVLMGKRENGRTVVADVISVRENGADVRQLIKNTAAGDNALYGNVKVRIPQDPGQAGKDQAQSFVKMLGGYSVKTALESGDKVTRAEPFSSQWLAGNVDVVLAEWNDDYFRQLEGFPVGKLKDKVDASANAYLELENGTKEFGYSFG